MDSHLHNRRGFLRSFVAGSALMPGLLHELAAADSGAADPLAPRQPQFPARARNVIFLFMAGAPYRPSVEEEQRYAELMNQAVFSEDMRMAEQQLLGAQRALDEVNLWFPSSSQRARWWRCPRVTSPASRS